jgi:hypothetical protein
MPQYLPPVGAADAACGRLARSRVLTALVLLAAAVPAADATNYAICPSGYTTIAPSTYATLVSQDYTSTTTYANSLSCEVTVYGFTNNYLRVFVSSFHTEAGVDTVTIFDGEDSYAPLLATLSGSVARGLVATSSSKAITIKFVTNANTVDFGFVLYVSALPSTAYPSITPTPSPWAVATANSPPADGSTLYVCPSSYAGIYTSYAALATGATYTVTSQADTYYGSDVDCSLRLVAPSGCYVSILSLSLMQLNKLWDYLYLSDETTTGDGLVYTGFSGPVTPLNLHGEWAMVRLTSAWTGSSKGFKMTVGSKCPPSPSNTPTTTPSISNTPSVSPSISNTPTPSVTPSRTPSQTPSPSPTPSTTSTASMTPTPSRTASPSPTNTPSPSATSSLTPIPIPSTQELLVSFSFRGGLLFYFVQQPSLAFSLRAGVASLLGLPDRSAVSISVLILRPDGDILYGNSALNANSRLLHEMRRLRAPTAASDGAIDDGVGGGALDETSASSSPDFSSSPSILHLNDTTLTPNVRALVDAFFQEDAVDAGHFL